jgi:hypothetical protein
VQQGLATGTPASAVCGLLVLHTQQKARYLAKVISTGKSTSLFVCACFVPEAAPVRVHNCKLIRRRRMRRNIFLATVGLGLLFGSAASSEAQVKRVQMHIAGYLCGN